MPEKMSKSRGNVITIDEVVDGVVNLKSGWEFRSICGDTMDPKDHDIYRAECGDYFTARRCGHRPVFLCRLGEPVPPLLLDGTGTARLQHPNEIGFWQNMLDLYEDARPIRR